MKQVMVRRGVVALEDVPAPVVEPGTVVVTVDHSCISVGTELSGIRASATPLWKKAVQQPQKVKRVVDVAASQGLDAARQLIAGASSSGAATGYSASGTVTAVGAGIEDLHPGDRVACAGAQSAHHAQVIRVSRNLTVPVPDGLAMSHASTVTLGAIALQGVRRATPTLGETFVVIGLGVLGQLVAQILKANGCRVIGIDLDGDRVRMATELGMAVGLGDTHDDDIAQVERLTDGLGADGVIITASTSSDVVVSDAFRMCRRKGRVVLVGDVGLDIDRNDLYAKELDFFISTSYGPGRYDQRYEEHGVDYPIAYVRWTENRNMGEYLRLVAEGRVDVAPLIGATFPLADVEDAYASVSGDRPSIMALLDYGGAALEDVRMVPNPSARPAGTGAIGVAVIGAGGFATSMHLPNIVAMKDEVDLRAIVSRTGHTAMETARRFGAGYAATELAKVLGDDSVDLLVVTTRHDTHASIALEGLQAGKHVLLEKPMALTRDELEQLVGFYEDEVDDKPILLTGFNRRFSAYGQRLAELTSQRSNPMVIDYRMNAGAIPLDHWVQTPEGGGRNLGEACHIYDLFTFLTGSRVESVQARGIRPQSAGYVATDNFATTIGFADGSIATLTYTALGSSEHAKERMEVFVDGRVIELDDYRRLSVTGQSDDLKSSTSQKGHREELQRLVAAVRAGGEWPIPLWQQTQATDIALRVEHQIRR